jgi:GNAT superfamily N-acetyltransferase
MDPSAQKRTIVRTTSPVNVHVLDRCDAGHVVDAVFAGLSPRSRYLRFHSPVPRLPATVRERLVDVDGCRRAALVAEFEGEPIGLAHVIGTGDGTADLAVAVVDAWQRRGAGTQLLTAAAALAERLGYTQLLGAVLPENRAMLGLVRRVVPWVRPRFDGEVVQLPIPLGAAAWSVTHEDLIADLVGT